MLLVALAGIVCSITGNLLASASTAFGRDLQEPFLPMWRSLLPRFNNFGTASLITRTTNDVQQMQMLFLMSMRMAMRAPLTAIGGVLMVVRKDPGLALILLAVMPLIFVIVGLVMAKGTPMFRSLQKKLDRLNQVLREQLMGVRVIRAFDRGQYEQERFSDANRDLTSTALKVNKLMVSMGPLNGLIINFTTISIIWFGAQRIDAGAMQVGDMMAFLQYAMQILWAIMMLSMLFVMLPRAMASAERLCEVLETEPTIMDPETPVVLSEVKGVVEFKNVTFSYPGAEEPVLSDISFRAEPGKMTAIIGGTGSGKSTILDLIPRFYDPQAGEITLDGVNVRI